MRRLLLRSVDPVHRFLKVGILGFEYVDELLRVSVNEWKPAALNLHHDPMSGKERVVLVQKVELDLCNFARDERHRVLVTISELAPEHVPCQHHLVVAHSNASRIRLRVGSIGRINIDELHHPVRVGSR